MPHKESLGQATREVPSTSMGESFIPPSILPICCMCGFVREGTGIEPAPHRERWVTQQTYLKTHGINPTKLALTHTYCRKCFTKFQNALRQQFRGIRTPS
jgi:hypothetical protein